MSKPVKESEGKAFLKGVAMGSADLIPGISGGTIALITGIYYKLIASVDEIFRLLNLNDIKDIIVSKESRKRMSERVDLPFVSFLLLGIVSAIFGLSRPISYLAENQAIMTYSFFGGLIIASSILLSKNKRFSIHNILIGSFGMVLGFIIAGFSYTLDFTGIAIVFISGMIAITAMILPGISGSFILLLMGQYERIINAVRDLDILTISIFAIGCAVGLKAFSGILRAVMDRWRNKAELFLIGLMVGSLRYQWNLVNDIASSSIDVSVSIISITIGISLIVLLERLSSYKHIKKEDHK